MLIEQNIKITTGKGNENLPKYQKKKRSEKEEWKIQATRMK